MKPRKYNWPELLKMFDKSGLTQTEFCEQQSINPKYFSLKRSKLLKSDSNAFEKVEVQKPVSSPINLTIQVGRCKIECPDNMPLESFTTLVHQLA